MMVYGLIKLMKKNIFLYGLGALFAFFAVSEYEKKCLCNAFYNIKSDKIIKPKRIVFLSDIHNRFFGKDYKLLTENIDKLNPDYVILGGDALSYKERYSLDYLSDLLDALNEKFGNRLIVSNGNHEIKYNLRCDSAVAKLIKEKNITYLSDSKTDLEEISIYGLDVDLSYYKRFLSKKMKASYIRSKLSQIDMNRYNILLPHNPEYFYAYEKWGADLVLAGHNHGGAVRLGQNIGAVTPKFNILSKNVAGMKKINKSYMIISPGLGGHTINIRFNNKPQIIVVDLERGN